MKNIILPFLFIYIQYNVNAQCVCSLHVTTTKQNAIANCQNGSITATITGDLCGSLTLATIRLKDSATLAVIETQLVSQVPGFVYFTNVPAGSYKIVVNHPCSPSSSIFQRVPAVVSDPAFIHASSDVSVFGCNDGAIGLEITGDYCPATLNIISQDMLPPYNTVNFTQTSYCSFCYLAENLNASVYKVDVFDSNNPIHHISYVTINEPACTFHVTANQGRLEPCVNENLVVHLLGDYCLSNTFSVRLYNSAMKLKDSIIDQVLNDTLVHFNNVKPGIYTVKVNYANCCTSSATAVIGKYCPVPVNLSESIIDTASYMLRWSGYPCLTGYEVSFKRKGTTAWQIISLTGASDTSTILTGLLQGVIYQWRVRSKCSGTKKSVYSSIKNFTIPNGNRQILTLSQQNVMIKPNPAEGIFNVTISKPLNNRTERIYNVAGELIFYREHCSANESYNLAQYPKGIYLLKAGDGNSTINLKIIH